MKKLKKPSNGFIGNMIMLITTLICFVWIMNNFTIIINYIILLLITAGLISGVKLIKEEDRKNV